jgi:hypothetical protein
MKFLHKYSTESDFEADYNGTAYTEPWVSLTEDVDRVDYNKIDADLIFDASDILMNSLKLVYSNPDFQVDGRKQSITDRYFYSIGSSSYFLATPSEIKVRILNAKRLSEGYENTLDLILTFSSGSGYYFWEYSFPDADLEVECNSNNLDFCIYYYPHM